MTGFPAHNDIRPQSRGAVLLLSYANVGSYSFYQYTLEGLGRAFADLGYEPVPVPFGEIGRASGSEVGNLLAAAQSHDVAFVLDLACWGHGFSQAGGDVSIFDALNLPYVAWLADHPQFQPTDRIRAKHLLAAAVDRSHVDCLGLIKQPGHIRRAFFLPCGAEPATEAVPPMAERPLDVLYGGNYSPAHAVPPWEAEPSQGKAFLMRAMAELLEGDETLAFHEAARRVFTQYNVQPGAGSSLGELYHEFLGKVENHLRIAKRYRYVEALAKGGIKVHVCGNGWETTPIAPLLHIHSPVDYRGFQDLHSQARISLCVSNYVDGMNDRPPVVMTAGSACLHDFSRYMTEAFEDARDILFARQSELGSLPERVRGLLAEPEKLQAIADSGRRRMEAEHSFDRRAEALLEAVARYRGEAGL